MKQVSLRLEDGIHSRLSSEAEKDNISLQQHIVKSICSMRDVYKTNLDNKIQFRVNLTYLGDLLVLGRKASFNGLYEMMKEALLNNEQVIIERHFENALPEYMITFNNVEDLETWRNNLLSINI